jgi:hypothetical protein
MRKVVLLVPLTFNDGSAVPQVTLDGLLDELFVVCGGYTLAGVVRGAFRMSSGAKQVEDLQQVWVVAAEADLPALRDLVRKYGDVLGQEAMYFEESDAVVEFLSPRVEKQGNGARE